MSNQSIRCSKDLKLYPGLDPPLKLCIHRNGFYLDISKIRFKVWPVKNYSF